MQHIAGNRPWRRRCAQLGLLAGTTLAFVGGSEPPRLAAGPRPCQTEGNCTFKKPLLTFVVDSSTAMNEQFEPGVTRWQRAVEAVEWTLTFDNGYVAENFIPGLVRFGHDPDPNAPGTAIAGDTTGLIDGQKLDVPWYDLAQPGSPYIECTNGDAIIAALEALPAPLGGANTGIGAWTHGALEFTRAKLAAAAADHPEDAGTRSAALIMLTTGRWTDPTGTQQQSPPAHDPTIAAAALWNDAAIPTHVIALGGPADQPLVDALAQAGATAQAFAPAEVELYDQMLKALIVELQQAVVAPDCKPDVPRLMIVLDASSSMLNLGDVRAAPGEGAWDLVRAELAALFDLPLNDYARVENHFYLGLAAFGGPAEQRLLVQYAPCREDHFAWALDPASSCEAPGCIDPYAAPPVAWTHKDGSMIDPPDFGSPTISHMPRCDLDPQQPQACSGSASYPHLGLALVRSNLDHYRSKCQAEGAPYPCDEGTPFLNILITDGAYDSTDAQVKNQLVSMHNAGITTHIIGFGETLDLDQLDKMAAWGSGDVLDPALAGDKDALAAAFKTILEPPTFNECCQFYHCQGFVDTEGGEGWDVSWDEDGGDVSTGTSDTEDTANPGDTANTTTTGDTDPGTTGPAEPGTTTSGDPTDPQCDSEPCQPTPTPTTGVPTSDGPPDPGSSSGTGEPGEQATDAGCGCDTRAVSPTASLLLLGLLARRRRRP